MNVPAFLAALADLAPRIFEATWQASVLAAIVLALQRLFRPMLPPAWAHLLWLPVVIRLLLPAVPENPVSLFNLAGAFASPPAASAKFVVETNLPWRGESLPGVETLAPSSQEAFEPAAAAAPIPFWPAMFGLVWFAGCLILLARSFGGALLLARRLRRAAPADAALASQFAAVQARLNSTWRFRLCETPLVDSPALFGFFRPTLLLPPGLRQRLTPAEFEHVLAHEIAHFQRGDLPWAWLMAIAQALHWFNPLAWLALARCRADREIACDARVLAALRETPPADYGQTILKLLAFIPAARPAPQLVGILESKDQIKRRLAQIASYQPPARSTWFPILLFYALILTGLGKATAQNPAPQAVANAPATENSVADPASAAPTNAVPSVTSTNRWDSFRLAGRFVFVGGTLDEALLQLETAITNQLSAGPAASRLDSASSLFALQQAVSIQPEGPARPGQPAAVYSVNAVGYINFRPGAEQSFGQRVFVRRFEFQNAFLREILGEIARGASERLAFDFSALGTPIIFSRTPPLDPIAIPAHLLNPVALFSRTYQLDPHAFIGSFPPANRSSSFPSEAFNPDYQKDVRAFFRAAGVDFPDEPPTGSGAAAQKALFYNDRTGTLFVRASLADHKIIESAVQTIQASASPPQVSIEIRIVELRAGEYDFAAIEAYLQVAHANLASGRRPFSQTPPPRNTGEPITWGLLTRSQFAALMRALEEHKGIDLLSVPKITTLTGRAAQISMKPGPFVDVLPFVYSDGRTLHLSAELSYSPDALEKYRPLKASVRAKLTDGQTLMFWPNPKTLQPGQPRLLIFATPVLIDPAGNPIHDPKNFPHENFIPPQDTPP